MNRKRNRRERQLMNRIADQLQQQQSEDRIADQLHESEDRIVRRLGDRISRSSRRGFIVSLLIAVGVGWLFRSQPPPQRRDVRAGTRHAIRGGGEPRVVNPGSVRFVFGVPRVAVKVHRG